LCVSLAWHSSRKIPRSANTVPTYIIGSRHSRVSRVTPYEAPAGLVKIYSNLGSKTDDYHGTNGWLISGPNSPFGEQQWVGYSFTPTKNHTATELLVALFYDIFISTGGNDFNIGIWSDSNGIPGKELSGGDKKNLPPFTEGGCCKLAKVIIKALNLKKDTPYWVVLSTPKKGTDSVGVWDFVYNDAVGTQAYDSVLAGRLSEYRYPLLPCTERSSFLAQWAVEALSIQPFREGISRQLLGSAPQPKGSVSS
jgi:hypothetical protein